MLHIIGIVEKAPLRDVEIPYVLDGWVKPHHRKGERTIIVLNGGFFLQHAHYMAAERNIVAQQLDIVIGEANLHACLIAARLLRCSPGEDPHRGRSETLKDGLNSLSEAVAVGEKQYDRGDAPSHSRHRQQGPAQIVAHGRVRLL